MNLFLKRTLASVVVLALWIVPLFFGVTQVQAETATRQAVFASQGCTEDGNSCACKIAVRQAGDTDPLNYFYIDGTTSSDIKDLTSHLIGLEENRKWEFAFYVKRPNNDEENCVVKYERTTDTISEEEFKKIENAIKIATAGIWPLNLYGAYEDFDNFLRGTWTGVKDFRISDSSDCQWTDGNDDHSCNESTQTGCHDTPDPQGGKTLRGWRVAGWQQVDPLNIGNKYFGRVSFYGDADLYDADFGDDHYCGLTFIRSKDKGITNQSSQSFELCRQLPGNSTDESTPRGKCQSCYDNNNNGIWTSLGCISSDQNSIVASLIRVALMLSGGVALLFILISAWKFSVSSGDPTKTGDAKAMLTSAIIGLLFIIFSVTILQFIGVTILKIPGFG